MASLDKEPEHLDYDTHIHLHMKCAVPSVIRTEALVVGAKLSAKMIPPNL